jgi:tRNA(Ile)-lysidine synthase
VTCSASIEALPGLPASPPVLDRLRESFRDRVFRAFDIVAGDENRLGLAVSGGSDSTALLMLAADWAHASSRTLRVATVDHGLRPEAAKEAQQVAALSAQRGLAHDTLVWRPGNAVAQHDARMARHRLLAEWARAHALPAICLGHTRDDRVETFLIRARAGSHWRGLAGPMPSAPSPVWPEGAGVRLARPLLAFGRQELRDDLVARATPWIDDPSNRAAKYERVRMRRLTARLDAKTLARILAAMDRLAEMRAAVVGAAREALASLACEAGSALLDAAVFRAAAMETRLRLTEALVMAAGGASFLPESARLARLVGRLAAPGGIGAGATLAGAWITETRGAIRFRPAPARRTALALNVPGPAPTFSPSRAHTLLADPRIAAFRV